MIYENTKKEFEIKMIDKMILTACQSVQGYVYRLGLYLHFLLSFFFSV